jgi:hypothetical protein
VAEWQLADPDRIVIRYEFASRRWSGTVEPYDDETGTFGPVRDLAPAQMLLSFFTFVLKDGRQPV